MKRDSDALADVNEKFRQIAPDYAISSFYETVHWPGTDTCIIDKTAARMQIDHEKEMPLAADHAAMCCFGSIEDIDFNIVCDHILKAAGIEAVDATGTARPTATGAVTPIGSGEEHHYEVAAAAAEWASDMRPAKGGKQQVWAGGESVTAKNRILPTPVKEGRDVRMAGEWDGGLLNAMWRHPEQKIVGVDAFYSWKS